MTRRFLPAVPLLLAALLAPFGGAHVARADPRPDPGALAAIEAEFRDAIRRVVAATVALIPLDVPKERAGFSSGVIVTRSGWVLSDGDAGLVEAPGRGASRRRWRDAVEVHVAGRGGSPRIFRARVVHRDRTSDTCLLKIERPPAGGLPYVPLGRSDAVRLGDFAFALGTAFDPAGDAPPTTTGGIIASLEEAASGSPGGRYAWLYTSAAVNQGVNGGPLVDVDGRLIGTISTFVEPTPQATRQFLGKAVPLARIRAVHAGVAGTGGLFATDPAAAAVRSAAPNSRALATVLRAASRRAGPSVVSLVVDRRTPLSDAVPTVGAGSSLPRYQGPVSGVVVSENGGVLTSLYNLTNVGSLVEPLWRPPAGAALEEGLAAIRGVVVCFSDGVEAPARLVATDRRLGVALLQADLRGRATGGGAYEPHVLEAAPAQSAEAGRFVIAVANPFGRGSERLPLLTAGILSRFHPKDAAAAWRGQWQTDAGGLDTNAGGAAVDLDGRLLGLFTIWHPARHGRNSGVAFVVPWSEIAAALPALERGQTLRPGFLGVSFGPGTAPRVAETIEGHAALAAGIRVGDLIRRIDAEDVTSVADAIAVLGYRCQGDRVRVVIEREGSLRTVPIVLGGRP